MRRFLYCLLFLFPLSFASSQQNSSARIVGHHKGQITALCYDEKTGVILSAGEDGFLGIWSVSVSGGLAGGRASGGVTDDITGQAGVIAESGSQGNTEDRAASQTNNTAGSKTSSRTSGSASRSSSTARSRTSSKTSSPAGGKAEGTNTSGGPAGGPAGGTNTGGGIGGPAGDTAGGPAGDTAGGPADSPNTSGGPAGGKAGGTSTGGGIGGPAGDTAGGPAGGKAGGTNTGGGPAGSPNASGGPAGGFAVERFQLSSYPISAMALRPGKHEIAIAETDGMGLYRVSVWDYARKRKFFTLRFRDPVSYLSYSAAGSFLIIARSGASGVVFLDCENGNQLEAPQGLNAAINFAVTGKSERTMLCYSPFGQLSYWNLETKEEMRDINVPSNIINPMLFSNNRLFAGFDSQGLVVIDATSGTVLGRSSEVRDGMLIAMDDESMEFICVDGQGSAGRILRFRVNASAAAASRLEVRSRRTLPGAVPGISAVTSAANDVALGGADGLLRLSPPNGNIRVFDARTQFYIHEAAIAGNTMAILNNNGNIAFISPDFNNYSSRTRIAFTGSGLYTNLNSDPSSSKGRFLLWYSGSSTYAPMIRTADGDSFIISKLSTRYPLQSAMILDERALFLDRMGNINVISLENGNILYNYSSLGAMDAAFLDKNNIIIGRSGLASSPFLKINMETKETVPLNYASDIGARLYRGNDGSIYAAAVDQNQENSVTNVIKLDTDSPESSMRLLEYNGEDTSFGIAECGGSLATTLGGDGATLFGRRGFVTFERSSGLPVKLISGKNYFIALDEDGSIIWHNPENGRIQAILRIYQSEWILEIKGIDHRSGPVEGLTGKNRR